MREREAGTIEQLLMSPATTTEIIIAKITPLFLLLSLMMIAAIIVIKVVFGVPFHGSLPLVLVAGCLCILSGISIGTVIATFSKSAQQAQLTSFFVNPPLSSLSGALNPVEAMPKVAPTPHRHQSGPPLRSHRPRNHAQGRRIPRCLAELPRLALVHDRSGFAQYLAIPQTT